MHNLQSQITDYLNYCQTQKRLDTKTLKAYRIDLGQFANQAANIDVEGISPCILENYISGLH